jgi:hypothetical protein
MLLRKGAWSFSRAHSASCVAQIAVRTTNASNIFVLLEFEKANIKIFFLRNKDT